MKVFGTIIGMVAVGFFGYSLMAGSTGGQCPVQAAMNPGGSSPCCPVASLGDSESVQVVAVSDSTQMDGCKKGDKGDGGCDKGDKLGDGCKKGDKGDGGCDKGDKLGDGCKKGDKGDKPKEECGDDCKKGDKDKLGEGCKKGDKGDKPKEESLLPVLDQQI